MASATLPPASPAVRVLNENCSDGVQNNYTQSGDYNNQNFHAHNLYYTAHTDPNRSLFIVPRAVNRLFIGREDVLTRLCKHLNHNDLDVEREKQTRIAITGIGGLGKSELCLKLINTVRNSYRHILWVDVGDIHAAEQAFISISRRLGFQPQSLEDAVSDLAGVRQAWLLVLDNADDPNTDYRPFFPSGSEGTVIITSRNPECGRTYGHNHHERLDVLDRTSSTDLLMRAADIDQTSALRAEAEKIAEKLRDHTLAVILAGSYIARGYCSVDGYLKVYEKNWPQVASYTSSQDRSRYGSVLSTFEASMAVLEDAKTEANSNALDMLCILSSLAASNVPLALFEEAWHGAVRVSEANETQDLYTLSKWHISKLPGFLRMAMDEWDSYRVTEAYNTLEALSLVTIAGNGHDRRFSMHPLIHEWTWRRQDRQQIEQSWLMAGSTLGLSIYNDNLWRRYENEYRLHLGSYVTTWWTQKLFPLPDLPVLQIVYKCADTLDQVRADRLALRCLNSIATSFDLGKEVDLKYAKFQALWARCRLRNGDSQGSIKLLEQVLKLRGMIAEDHPDRLSSQYELACAYQANGQVKEAVALLEHVVKIGESVLAEDHPDRLASQHALAGAYQADGQVKEAVALLEHVVKIGESVLAEDHPGRLALQYALACAYQANGQVKEAVALLEHVVKIKESVLAEDHPDRLVSQHALAGAYQADGQVKEAVALLEYVVKVRESVLAEDHLDRLASQYELACAYQANGQVKEAVALLEHVVKVEESVLAEDHPDRLASQHALAGAYQANGQAKEAVTLLEHVVKVEESVLAEDHPDRLASQYALVCAYRANGQVKEAVLLLEHVVDIEAITLLQTHSDRQVSQEALVDAYRLDGQMERADQLHRVISG